MKWEVNNLSTVQSDLVVISLSSPSFFSPLPQQSRMDLSMMQEGASHPLSNKMVKVSNSLNWWIERQLNEMIKVSNLLNSDGLGDMGREWLGDARGDGDSRFLLVVINTKLDIFLLLLICLILSCWEVGGCHGARCDVWKEWRDLGFSWQDGRNQTALYIIQVIHLHPPSPNKR